MTPEELVKDAEEVAHMIPPPVGTVAELLIGLAALLAKGPVPVPVVVEPVHPGVPPATVDGMNG